MSDNYTWCFACGKDNPIGLKLEFELTDKQYTTYFFPEKEHQSYNGQVHGGILSTLMDEVMAGYVYKKTGTPSFTARLEVRYRQPVSIEQKIKIVATEINNKGRLYEMKAELFLENGVLAVEATGKIMKDK